MSLYLARCQSLIGLYSRAESIHSFIYSNCKSFLCSKKSYCGHKVDQHSLGRYLVGHCCFGSFTFLPLPWWPETRRHAGLDTTLPWLASTQHRLQVLISPYFYHYTGNLSETRKRWRRPHFRQPRDTAHQSLTACPAHGVQATRANKIITGVTSASFVMSSAHTNLTFLYPRQELDLAPLHISKALRS